MMKSTMAAVLLGTAMISTAMHARAAPAARESGMTQKVTVRVDDVRYAIPRDYLDGPLEPGGEQQHALLLRAMLPGFTPDSGDAGQGRARDRMLVNILLEEPAVKAGVVQDMLATDYRLYAGDLTAQGMATRAHRFEPAFDGLRRVADLDESSERWKRYPDVYIEGDEQHPTTVMTCNRAGVGIVNFPQCVLAFMAGRIKVSVHAERDQAPNWRALRTGALRLLDDFKAQAQTTQGK
ncbi:hypothetical protein CAL29_02570 [Bordetella genomosp. 10]|uniref:Uncharacterized protein n=1 Tax=Bordetella genomosp. 10 TaxID=1416804 RepID=A0A261SK54_9BORD|nr:hypothetical protein [Bordetella genomosp. 10]OZI37322.1 hypothetical protein CAL29_02570 [Bordetella genomosp. 10]